tara:strand:- start:92 stop:598 length:507 start_codon:yes stop_codon:yes gene_type:complete
MASFTAQIGFLAGTTTGKTTEIAQYLKEGLEDVIAKVSKLKPNEMPLFAKEVGINNEGYALGENGIVMDVQINGTMANHVKAKHRYDVIDSGSMYYANSFSPVFWVLNGKVYIAPYAEQASSAPSDSEVDSISYSLAGGGAKDKSSATAQGQSSTDKTASKTADKAVT